MSWVKIPAKHWCLRKRLYDVLSFENGFDRDDCKISSNARIEGTHCRGTTVHDPGLYHNSSEENPRPHGRQVPQSDGSKILMAKRRRKRKLEGPTNPVPTLAPTRSLLTSHMKLKCLQDFVQSVHYKTSAAHAYLHNVMSAWYCVGTSSLERRRVTMAGMHPSSAIVTCAGYRPEHVEMGNHFLPVTCSKKNTWANLLDPTAR